MAREVFRKIIDLILEAANLARSIGIPNLLQPGLVKEMMIADALGHRLITSKRDADACDPNNPAIVYEYLSCKEGGKGQFDRMFKEPPEKRALSLQRIERNRFIYFAVFFANEQTRLKVIYEIDVPVMLKEVERQLDASGNAISHVGFSPTWAAGHGRIVYEAQS